MELHDAVAKLLEPYESLESAESEINAIGIVLQVLKKTPYSGQKRLLEYVGHWVESEHKRQEKVNAEIKAITASKNSGREQSRSPHRTDKYTHSQISELRRALKKFRAERKSRRAALKGLKRVGDSGYRENIEMSSEASGISKINLNDSKGGE